MAQNVIEYVLIGVAQAFGGLRSENEAYITGLGCPWGIHANVACYPELSKSYCLSFKVASSHHRRFSCRVGLREVVYTKNLLQETSVVTVVDCSERLIYELYLQSEASPTLLKVFALLLGDEIDDPGGRANVKGQANRKKFGWIWGIAYGLKQIQVLTYHQKRDLYVCNERYFFGRQY